MNILFHCPTKFDLNSISNSKLGGIETLNLELCKNLSFKCYNIYLSTICKKVIKRKNLTNLPISKLKKENHNYNFDYIVSSNDPNIFNLFRNSKKIFVSKKNCVIALVAPKSILCCRKSISCSIDLESGCPSG